MAAITPEFSIDSIPAVKQSLVEPDISTSEFICQQTMLRIKDSAASVAFYSEVLGMRLLKKYDFPQWKFSLYFMGYCDPASIPETGSARTMHLLRQRGAIELTHNHDSAETYVDGNSVSPYQILASLDLCLPHEVHPQKLQSHPDPNQEPFRGFGHIGLTVPNVYAACARFESLGCNFRKKPDEGGMKGLAFIRDPDGYSIEILAADPGGGADVALGLDEGEVARTRYAMTQTMYRVRDPAASLKFYSEVNYQDHVGPRGWGFPRVERP